MISYKVVDPGIYLKGMKFLRWAVKQGGGKSQDLSEYSPCPIPPSLMLSHLP